MSKYYYELIIEGIKNNEKYLEIPEDRIESVHTGVYLESDEED